MKWVVEASLITMSQMESLYFQLSLITSLLSCYYYKWGANALQGHTHTHTSMACKLVPSQSKQSDSSPDGWVWHISATRSPYAFTTWNQPKWFGLGAASHPGYIVRTGQNMAQNTPHPPIPFYVAWIHFLFFIPALPMRCLPLAGFVDSRILFLSILSISLFSSAIPSTVPPHTDGRPPPTPQALAQASVTGGNRLGQLKPPSSASFSSMFCLWIPACLGSIT